MKLKSDITPSVFRVFVAVVALAQEQRGQPTPKPITLRAVAKRLGIYFTRVAQCLPQLKALGLVDYQEHTHGTIRPLRRLELCEG